MMRHMLVRQMTLEAEGVLSLQLVDPDGASLPAWQPGAHIDLMLPSGRLRQYSLCGDPADRSSFVVAVLNEPQGRGGSLEIHETAMVGRSLQVHGPRNHFALTAAKEYVFIAGGIGITPILAMVRELNGAAATWRLFYGGRSRRSMAFLNELTELGRSAVRGSQAVVVVPQNEQGMLNLDEIFASVPEHAEIYCCGPDGLIRAVEDRCRDRWVLHVERFGVAAAPTEAVADTDDAPIGFEVELRRAGLTLQVPPDQTLLSVVREAVPDVLYDCEEGFCGSCETGVLEGVPQHHDIVLSPQERAEGKTMMICVGRSESPRLVLDV